MNTKNKYLIIGSLSIAGLMLPSCDNIDENERYIKIERPHSEKVVLMKKFTGQRCMFCPNGDEAIKNLEKEYGDNFIAVGLHPVFQNEGSFTSPVRGLDLRCDAATTYYNYYKPDAFPAAVIDGNTYDGNNVFSNITLWGRYVSQASQVVAPADITLESEYDESTREVTISYDILFNDVVSDYCEVQLWIIENGIIGSQLTPTGTYDHNYVHNHTLRAAVNGDWGETVPGNLIPSYSYSGEAKYVLKDDWVSDNCEVVGFIARSSDKVVLQAAKIKLVNNIND